MSLKDRMARLANREQRRSPAAPTETPGRTERGEPLGPVLAALLVAIALPYFLPSNFHTVATVAMTAIEVVLIIAMVALDPGRIDGHSVLIRRVRIALIAILVARAAFASIALTAALLTNDKSVRTSGELFRSGGVVWAGLVISFAFLYWEMDGGGPGIRAHFPIGFPDLAFPQQFNPELAQPGWKPQFGDYLYVGVTTGLAFSPTDAMPLSRWVKLAMGTQSLASLLVIGLVIAQAINVLN